MECSPSPEQPSVGVLVAEVDGMAARLLTADLRRQRRFHVIECTPRVASILSPDVLLVSASLPEGARASWPC